MKRVELYTCQKAKGEYVCGYPCLHGLFSVTVDSGGGYNKLAATARRLSKSIGRDFVMHHMKKTYYHETAELEKGLAAVKIVTYVWGKDETIEEHDFFENGRYSYTIREKWADDGYTKDKYTK